MRDRRWQQWGARRWNWAQIATAVGAVAAGAGLIFTGISTYMGMLVAQLQLEQSRQGAEDQARRQASMVVTWRGDPVDAMVVSNRSALPVVGVSAHVPTHKKVELLGLGDLPPCSQITLDPTAVKQALELDEKQPGVGLQVAVFTFTDSKGVEWARTTYGGLQRTGKGVLQDILSPYTDQPYREPDPSRFYPVLEAEAKPASPCATTPV